MPWRVEGTGGRWRHAPARRRVEDTGGRGRHALARRRVEGTGGRGRLGGGWKALGEGEGMP